MNTYTFVKKDGRWHVDAPTYLQQGGNTDDLAMTYGADAMLNLMSNGNDSVTLTLNTEPFDNADVLELVQTCKPFMEGGYYSMNKHNGAPINYNMWLHDVTRFVFGDTPDKIYIRREQAF
jgi:hypothetical protein